MKRGDLVVVAKRVVVAEDVKPDGSKVKVKGTWLPVSVVEPASPAIVRAVQLKQARHWARIERDLRRLLKMIDQLDRSYRRER